MKNPAYVLILLSAVLLSQLALAQTNNSQADTVKTALSRAQFFVKQGNTEEASKIYKNIMENHPDNRGAVQGWLMLNMKRTPTGEEEAIKQLEELGKFYPRNTAIIFFRAFIQAEYGHNEEALKDLDKLIELQPDTALNYIGKGQILNELKRYQEAFEAFDKATTLNPGRQDVWGMKAGTLAGMGKFEEALASINKGFEIVPNNPVNFYNRACIYSLKGDKANALADLKKAIDMNPSYKKYSAKDVDFKSLYDDEDFKKLTYTLGTGQKAPEFTLNDVSGNPITLSSKIGSKLLLIDFWAGWCGPCRQENPNVVRTYNEFKEKGLDIIGVSLDRSRDTWTKAINDDKLSWTQVSDLNYFNGKVVKLYDVYSIPSNFLLDEKGMIIETDLRGENLYNKIKEILVP